MNIIDLHNAHTSIPQHLNQVTTRLSLLQNAQIVEKCIPIERQQKRLSYYQTHPQRE
jgi:hypothetical protein